MKRLAISIFILFIITGCVSGPPVPPTTDRCVGLHTIGLPECSPPDSLPDTQPTPRHQWATPSEPTQAPALTNPIPAERSVTILVDDFSPQPYQGDAIYFYNRLEGDRGALNDSAVFWGNGEVEVTITEDRHWGGLWMSLNHPIREKQSINFSAILPAQILPPYQGRITGLTISISRGTPSKIIRAELKDTHNNLQWANELVLDGSPQTMDVDLPPLQDINELILVLDQAAAGDYVVIDNISLTAATPVTDTATAAFVWSYGMLLNNWNPRTGLVRDKARDGSGEFDAIQATGSLAAATALADQLAVIDHAQAVAIVMKISDTLLNKLPRDHGLWPHWVTTSPDGRIEIVANTEWSSVDTAITAIALLDAQHALGIGTSATEQMLRQIEWDELITAKGISHGYTYDHELIPYAWDVFGGESWLVELAYASATGNIAPIAYPTAPTANGSGFIDELAWLYVRPPAENDYWGTDWVSYRTDAVEKQISYFATGDISPCFTQLGLFGLSAAEAPVPAQLPKENIYQAFGIGGQFAAVNDGGALGSPAFAPHYSAMVASLRPREAIRLWDWLIESGYFSPMNNVESLTFPPGSNCAPTDATWNQLKGSWNLALQALGWGRYLAKMEGQNPAVWQATTANPFLKKGYLLLVPDETQEAAGLPNTLGRLDIACEAESDYLISIAGTYGYKSTDRYGDVNYVSVEQRAGNEGIDYVSDLGWPPEDNSIPPWITPTTESRMEGITTPLGTFQAFRIDEWLEYRVFTTNHSDPSGTVTKSEWYVCGVGLIRATIDHTGTYQGRPFERAHALELISFTPSP